VRYHGILAPNARDQTQVVPDPARDLLIRFSSFGEKN
jgi:hypothetical protein